MTVYQLLVKQHTMPQGKTALFITFSILTNFLSAISYYFAWIALIQFSRNAFLAFILTLAGANFIEFSAYLLKEELLNTCCNYHHKKTCRYYLNQLQHSMKSRSTIVSFSLVSALLIGPLAIYLSMSALLWYGVYIFHQDPVKNIKTYELFGIEFLIPWSITTTLPSSKKKNQNMTLTIRLVFQWILLMMGGILLGLYAHSVTTLPILHSLFLIFLFSVLTLFILGAAFVEHAKCHQSTK